MLVGVVGANHVGVVEQADDLHLAKESSDGMLRRDAHRQDDLERDHAIHQSMPRLEHSSHGAGANVLQQHVASIGQSRSLPHQQPTRLQERQHPVLDELVGQDRGRNIPRLSPVGRTATNVPQHRLGENSQLLDSREEFRARKAVGDGIGLGGHSAIAPSIMPVERADDKRRHHQIITRPDGSMCGSFWVAREPQPPAGIVCNNTLANIQISRAVRWGGERRTSRIILG